MALFGVLMLMGLKELPTIRCYWSPSQFYGCPIISEVFTRRRFEAIIRCIHLVNNDTLVQNKGELGYDKLGKVRWLVDRFAEISQSLYNAQRTCTVDEIMIPYKGRYCNIRQYMKAKPVKFGIKVWALASSQSRYISNVIVYLGAGDAREEAESVSADAVLTAVRGMEGRGHVIVTDNYFTSIQLFEELRARGFWATGTCRKARKGFPVSLAGFPKSALPPRGTLVTRMHRDRHVAAICWIDSKPVFLISTACNPIDPAAFVGRWVGRERVDFPTSPILLEYQSNMRGVDVVDQQRQEYTMQLQSHKWWHRLLLFITDSSILNSYILYVEDLMAVGLPYDSRVVYQYRLAMVLVRERLDPNRLRGRHGNLAPNGFHRSKGHPNARYPCVACGRRTRKFCGGCAANFMCESPCYIRIHSQPAYRALTLFRRRHRN